MRRITLFAAVGLLVSLALGAFAHAITFGENDNGRHPFVGSLVFEFQGQKGQGCSGTLVSPTVFVTAGHCLFGLDQFGVTGVWVTFDEVIDADADGVVDAGVTLHGGTAHVHPDWGFPGLGGNAADPHDVAVFVLDSSVSMANYGQLPTAGLLETIDKRATRFTTVGYGTVRDDKTRSFKSLELGTRRKMVTQSMLSLTPAWVQFSMNPSTGSGGTCFGDSGGPHFLGAGATETRVILAVTVTGDRFCRATDKTYRLDTPSARSFLDDFVALP
jgi:secreted trypsin-like serine protease